jgi:hypothetical protein
MFNGDWAAIIRPQRSSYHPHVRKVWGDGKLVHLSGLPVADTGEDPLSQVCGTVSSECLSGLYPTPIRSAILKTYLFWCMNGKFAFLMG